MISNTTSFLRNLHNGAEVREVLAGAGGGCCVASRCFRSAASLCTPTHPSTGHCRCHPTAKPSLPITHHPSTAKQIFLVGTAHVSKLSAKEVSDMIRLVKPQVGREGLWCVWVGGRGGRLPSGACGC